MTRPAEIPFRPRSKLLAITRESNAWTIAVIDMTGRRMEIAICDSAQKARDFAEHVTSLRNDLRIVWGPDTQ